MEANEHWYTATMDHLPSCLDMEVDKCFVVPTGIGLGKS